MIHTGFGVLRGAGDTRFLMLSAACISVFALILPAWLAVNAFQAGIVPLWGTFFLYALVLAVVLALRYRCGAWQKIRLVDPATPAD